MSCFKGDSFLFWDDRSQRQLFRQIIADVIKNNERAIWQKCMSKEQISTSVKWFNSADKVLQPTFCISNGRESTKY